jgi:hypothetical protein
MPEEMVYAAAAGPIDKVNNIYNGLLMMLESASHLCEMTSFNNYAMQHGWGRVYEPLTSLGSRMQAVRLYRKRLVRLSREIASSEHMDEQSPASEG